MHVSPAAAFSGHNSMGAGSSLRKKKDTTSKVTAFDLSEVEAEDDPDDIDWSIGFNKKAARHFGWGGNPSGEVRDESDEFRVLRVSSLSENVTLYVAGGKHKKPTQYSSARACPRAEDQPAAAEKCPFCPGNEHNTPPSILSYDSTGEEQSLSRPPGHLRWEVRCFPNIFPMLICPLPFYGERHREALQTIPHSIVAEGLHANHKVKVDANVGGLMQVDALGVSEVIVESPVHNALLALQEPAKIRLLLKALVARGKAVAQQPWAKQLLMFKQYGPLSGGSLVHPHTQLVSLPVLPPQIKSRIEYSLSFKAAHGCCCVCLSCIDPFVKRNKSPNDPSGLGRTDSAPARVGFATNGAGTPHSTDPALKRTFFGLNSGSRKGELPPIQAEPLGMVGRDVEHNEGERPSRLVHVTDHFVVMVPYASSSQYSMVVAPIRHSAHFLEATQEELDDLADILALLSQAVYYGLDDPSYNIFIRTGPSVDHLKINNRAISSEELNSSFHWILEFRPRFPADLGGFEIASGIRVVTGLPEDHAAELRQWVQERLAAKVVPVRPAQHVFIPPVPIPDGNGSRPQSRTASRQSTRRESKGSRWLSNSGGRPRMSFNLGHLNATRPDDTGKDFLDEPPEMWQRNVSVP